MSNSADVAVIGAGIVGLAFADVAARQGRKVVLFERDAFAQGASIRNFGMIWPIGQKHGRLHQLAMHSRERWLELAGQAGFHADPCGSLHLAQEEDEWAVLREFANVADELGYECKLVDEDEAREYSAGVRTDDLIGALYSPSEVFVEPRQAILQIPQHLTTEYGVELSFGTTVTSVRSSEVRTAAGEVWNVGRAVVASGADFRTLFPDVFAGSGIRRCKLQMMRTVAQPDDWKLGSMIAGGLTLRHYPTFQICPSVRKVEERVRTMMPEFDRLGIHVMVSQNATGELMIGDSHEYGEAIDPFDRAHINEMILGYLRKIADFPIWVIGESWHGVNAEHPTEPIFVAEPESGVHVVSATGGAGMTMAFGWAAELWPQWA